MTNTIKLFPILLVAVWLLFEHLLLPAVAAACLEAVGTFGVEAVELVVVLRNKEQEEVVQGSEKKNWRH